MKKNKEDKNILENKFKQLSEDCVKLKNEVNGLKNEKEEKIQEIEKLKKTIKEN